MADASLATLVAAERHLPAVLRAELVEACKRVGLPASAKSTKPMLRNSLRSYFNALAALTLRNAERDLASVPRDALHLACRISGLAAAATATAADLLEVLRASLAAEAVCSDDDDDADDATAENSGEPLPAAGGAGAPAPTPM